MKRELKIPTSLDEITLRQYQSFVAIKEPTHMDMLRCFLGLSVDDINAMHVNDVTEISQELDNLFNKPKDITYMFKIGKAEFGFIPVLDEITFGENADLLKYIREWDKMHLAMAVLYRPIKIKHRGSYQIQEYNGTSKYGELMKDMPISVVLGAQVFFYSLTKELLNSTLSYLEDQMEQQPKLREHLEKSGESITSSLNLLKETIKDLMPSPETLCTNAITT